MNEMNPKTTFKNIWKNKKVWAVIFIAVFLLFYKPRTMESVRNVFVFSFRAVTDIQSFNSNLKTPRAGEYVLPSAVREMLAFLRDRQPDSYMLSEQIMAGKNILIRQRIVESAWPIRVAKKSNYKLILINELDKTSGCRVMESGREAALVFCH
jgi:hypothetical protein